MKPANSDERQAPIMARALPVERGEIEPEHDQIALHRVAQRLRA
jgi:hypothetical protein